MKEKILGLILCLGSFNLLAALPPLGKWQQERYSTHVIEGEVLTVWSEVVNSRAGNPEFQDTKYWAKVKVFKFVRVEQEADEMTNEIEVHFWKPAKRPRGWTGPQGQTDLLQAGDFVRLYLTKDSKEKHGYHLINPNGWELITDADQSFEEAL